MTLKKPVLFLIFNRPATTQRVFEAIRTAKPSQLFVAADGPRSDHATDTERCRDVRAIIEQVDWPCEVHKNYSAVNLGCKMRPKTGIDWVFSQVDSAIILEDDCLPNPDFFTFCEALLDKYSYDERISVITGDNFQDGRKWGDASYYFSKYNHVSGWATWRRSWMKNDSTIKFWPEFKGSPQWKSLLKDTVERRYWENIFDRVYAGKFESAWDYPWTASVWYHGGLTATPNVNLVTHIGIGPDGTHTVSEEYQDGLLSYPLGPLTHPPDIEQNRKADRYVFDHLFGGLQQRLHRRLLGLPGRITGKVARMLFGGA